MQFFFVKVERVFLINNLSNLICNVEINFLQIYTYMMIIYNHIIIQLNIKNKYSNQY